MAVCGNCIQRVKIVINDNPIEQVSNLPGIFYARLQTLFRRQATDI